MRVSHLSGRRRSLLSLALLLLGLLALAAVLWLSPRLTSTAPLTHGNERVDVRRSGLSSLIVYDGPPASGDGLDDEEYSTVIYKGMTLPKNDSEINGIKITDAARVQIIATARDANGEIPYVVRSGSFWYFADSVFGFNSESDRSIVFADLL